MGLIEELKKGTMPGIVKSCAEKEHVAPHVLRDAVLRGSVVVPRSMHSPVSDEQACAIGKGLRTKVNANIGSSPDRVSIEGEVEKLRTAVAAGADAVMDLSIGGDITGIRKTIRTACRVPLGTVPVYQALCETVRSGKGREDLDPGHLFAVIEQHADEGIDFITVHCGITKETVRKLKNSRRLAGVVSRGGSFLVHWMEKTGRENPLFEQFDRLLAIARAYDLTLSLGDGFRPGALADASDRAQLGELNVLGELVERSRDAGVQVMVEGPGHVPIHQIAANIETEKTICKEAPFYVLGPLVTDVAAGYDHVTSAIGGAVAAAAGADFLCYVTPSEHIHLPGPDDVRQGVIASRIAAHAGDIAKNVPDARAWDDAMSAARKSLDWEKQRMLALDKDHFNEARQAHAPAKDDVCTMCGEFCAMKDILTDTGQRKKTVVV